MKFSELIRSLPSGATSSRGAEIGLLDFFGSEEADLSQPRYNSKDVASGDTFFAIKGFTSDGHAYIPMAIERGAATIVVDDPESFTREDAERAGVNRILVQDSRQALAMISEYVFGKPSSKLRLIGVTGTNGKTTTTNIIRQLLRTHGENVGIIGTIGIWIGDDHIEATHTTPESRDLSELLARMVTAGVTTCVMEVSSHALALKRVAALDFDIAVFTNLTQDHLDFHQTMEDYFKAKQILFNGLKDVAVAVTNADDAYGERMVENTVANSHTYGIRVTGDTSLGHADLFAADVQLSVGGTRFTVQKRYSDERATVETTLIGSFNVENLMAAIAGLYFGVEGYSLEVLAELCKTVEPVRGRFETVPLPNGATAVIDYAHTPDALENVLSTLRSLQSDTGSIITVFGCGGDRDRTKRPKMDAIASELSDHVVVTSDNPRSEDPGGIVEEIWTGIPGARSEQAEIILDRAEAIRKALDRARPGDAVLIAGKGHETYQIVGSTKTHFDDREEVLKWQESHVNAGS